jgi:pimeloyl-ACP methyl ester carboxylesterase
MKKLVGVALLAAVLLLPALPAWAVDAGAGGVGEGGLAGIWQGTLDAMGSQLRVVFTVSEGEGGTYSATMASPDQGAEGIPVEEAVLDGAAVRFAVPSVMGSYLGVLGEDGATITGEWSQGGMTLPLALERVAEAPKLARPQEPAVGESLYRSEQATYQNLGAGITIGGTITIPQGAGPFPAIILISGSGPQDRNETVFGHRPFMVLADNLTQRGIAVLRVDDRGVGATQGDLSQSTSRDLADDVRAGIEFLKTRPDIDPKRIGLLGHSEGALIAPMVAVDTEDVAFIVLLAPPGIVGEEVLYDQARRISGAAGETPEGIARGQRLQEAVFAVVKAQPDNALATEELHEVFKAGIAELPEATQAELAGSLEAFVDGQVRVVIVPSFRFFLTYDPAPALAQVKCPVLALFGGKDLQVSPGANLGPIEAALKAGGNADYTVKTFDAVNHLFQTATTGLPTEYPTIQETMSPEVLQFMGDWILARFGAK